MAAGMVAAINPCGFSLLPAYIAFFVTGERQHQRLDQRLAAAVWSAAAVTAGFVAVFVALGLLLDSLADKIRPGLPWVTVLIGAIIVIVGVATVAGRPPTMPRPAIRVVSGRNPVAMFAYGVVYALASLSCTLGPFLAVTTVAITGSVIGGLATFIAYGLGMGVVILMLAAAAAFAQAGPARRLRRFSRHAVRIGGALMVVSGLYAIWYARWELAVYGGDLRTDPIVSSGENLRLAAVRQVDSLGAPQLFLIISLTVGLIAVTARSWRPPPSDRGDAAG